MICKKFYHFILLILIYIAISVPFKLNFIYFFFFYLVVFNNIVYKTPQAFLCFKSYRVVVVVGRSGVLLAYGLIEQK